MNPFQKALERINRKLTLMVGRAVLEAVTDSTSMQTVKITVLDGDTDDEVEHMQPGGLSHVASGGEGVALSVGGSTDGRVVLAISKRGARPTGLLPGETAVYSEGGVVLKLGADGTVSIVGATKLIVDGDIEATGDVVALAAMPVTLVPNPATAVHLSTHLHPTAMGPSGPATPGT